MEESEDKLSKHDAENEVEPDLMSEDPAEPPRRSTRTREAPPRYNPQSGRSYAQVLNGQTNDEGIVPKKEKGSVVLTPLGKKSSKN